MIKIGLKSFCLLSLMSISFFAISCKEFKNNNKVDLDLESSVKQIKNKAQVKNIFYNVPSPLEVTNIIGKMSLIYQPDVMNSVFNSQNYLSQADIALNLGVYGADLSYIRIYEQFQDAARYLAVIKKFSRKLGIREEQEQIIARRLSENIQSQDSLVSIVTETFTNSDAYLKENKRGGAAALIVLGGWIETLHIATNIIDINKPKKEMLGLIVEQKLSIRNLISLLEQYPNEIRIIELLPKVKELDNKFHEIERKNVKPSGIKNINGKMVIGSKKEFKVNPSTLLGIKTINDSLRSSIIDL